MRRASLAAVAAAGALLAAAAASPAAADARVLRTALPLVVLKTDRAIPNDPKVRARVRVIDRRRGPNRTRDRGNVYAGFGGIELRGHSSLAFPKKQYGLELRDRRGEGRDAGLLGMPKDDDWVLSAPYTDKSLMRNALAYETARQSFGRYAPRTRYVEVVLNGRYRGVYVLTQKLELGKGRIEDGEGDGWLVELVFGYQARGERRSTGPRTRRPCSSPTPTTRRASARGRLLVVGGEQDSVVIGGHAEQSGVTALALAVAQLEAVGALRELQRRGPAVVDADRAAVAGAPARAPDQHARVDLVANADRLLRLDRDRRQPIAVLRAGRGWGQEGRKDEDGGDGEMTHEKRSCHAALSRVAP